MQDKLDKVIDVLKAGGVCILPSDTCYMLAGDANNQKAVEKILQIKTNMVGRPISVIVSNLEMVREYCDIEVGQEETIRSLLPGPYTLILPAKKKLALGMVSKQKTLGIRIPNNKFLLEVVAKFGGPITATSAEIYGESVPYSLGFLKKLSKGKLNLIDYVLNVGKLPTKNLSTLINMVDGKVMERKGLLGGKREEVLTNSEEETGETAKKILKKELENISKPLVFLLIGDLGGGKTTFAKAVGKELGVNDLITSPTFNIYDEYGIDILGKRKFLHMDLYRLNSEEDFEKLHFLELFAENMVACVEWPEKMSKISLEVLRSKAKVIMVGFEYKGENSRLITF